MVYVFLADGFETIEALTPVDMLRRAGIEVVTVSINKTVEVISAQKVKVIADVTLNDMKDKDATMYVLPGGIPGTPNLGNNETVMNLIKTQFEENKLVGAICAAPTLLAKLGILNQKNAICYPGYEEELEAAGATIQNVNAVKDGNVITGRAMGGSIEFSAKIIAAIKGEEVAKDILDRIVYL